MDLIRANATKKNVSYYIDQSKILPTIESHLYRPEISLPFLSKYRLRRKQKPGTHMPLLDTEIFAIATAYTIKRNN